MLGRRQQCCDVKTSSFSFIDTFRFYGNKQDDFIVHEAEIANLIRCFSKTQALMCSIKDVIARKWTRNSRWQPISFYSAKVNSIKVNLHPDDYMKLVWQWFAFAALSLYAELQGLCKKYFVSLEVAPQLYLAAHTPGYLLLVVPGECWGRTK